MTLPVSLEQTMRESHIKSGEGALCNGPPLAMKNANVGMEPN